MMMRRKQQRLHIMPRWSGGGCAARPSSMPTRRLPRCCLRRVDLGFYPSPIRAFQGVEITSMLSNGDHWVCTPLFLLLPAGELHGCSWSKHSLISKTVLGRLPLESHAAE